MNKKITADMKFSVDRGTEEQLKKILAVFGRDGIKCVSGNVASYMLETMPKTIRNIRLNLFGCGLSYMGMTDEKGETHYTAEQFLSEFGDMQPAQPAHNLPDLEGPIIPLGGKFYRAVSKEKGWVSDEGVECLVGNGSINTAITKLILIVTPKKMTGSDLKFVAKEHDCYFSAWIEVPAPEPLEIDMGVALEILEKHFGQKVVMV